SRTAAVRTELGLRDGVPVIGVIARRKSQDDLLRAVQSHQGPLEILFSGIEEDAELAALRATLPEGVRVQCLGFRPDVAEISALLDVFVLPSGIEGFSLAILEAMARGLPCIATDAGGNREALDNGAGIIVPPGDPEALAKALARLLRDPDAARRMGAAARRRALDEFDVARTVERTEALYERVLAERSR
ncbi:MAG: glycosyltransferase, partial [Gemmatimonadetes bacterium]|nr:glycosyltransferase [Gemmatimonadota bacterium]